MRNFFFIIGGFRNIHYVILNEVITDERSTKSTNTSHISPTSKALSYDTNFLKAQRRTSRLITISQILYQNLVTVVEGGSSLGE